MYLSVSSGAKVGISVHRSPSFKISEAKMALKEGCSLDRDLLTWKQERFQKVGLKERGCLSSGISLYLIERVALGLETCGLASRRLQVTDSPTLQGADHQCWSNSLCVCT